MPGEHYSVTGALVNGQPQDISDVKNALDNIDEAVYQTNRGYYPFKFLSFDTQTAITISGNAATITQGFHSLIPEGGSGSDDLETISGGVQGQLLMLILDDPSDFVTLKHNVDNIWLSRESDMTLAGYGGLLLFFDGTFWRDGASIPFSVPTSDILAVQVFS